MFNQDQIRAAHAGRGLRSVGEIMEAEDERMDAPGWAWLFALAGSWGFVYAMWRLIGWWGVVA